MPETNREPQRLSFSPENVLREEITKEQVKIKVPSNSNPGTFYYVTVILSCECKSWKYRSKCAHVHSIIDELAPRPAKLKENVL